MQHHRTPFTHSRFVTNSSDTAARVDENTVFTPADDASFLVDTGSMNITDNSGATSPWDRDHETEDYAASTPAYASAARSDRTDGVRRRRSVPASQFLSAPVRITPAASVAVGVVATDDVTPVRTGGAHRIPAPPNALKGRVAVVAVAAGAVVAAGQAALADPAAAPERTDTSEYALAAGAAPVLADVAMVEPEAPEAPGVVSAPPAGPPVTIATSTGAPISAPTNSAAPQILNIAAPVDLGQFSELLAKGQRFAEERLAREAEARRPLFALPAAGTYTSGYGARWGTLHAGVDIANAIGTPVFAVADGVVVDSGPAAGFGLWVRILHADGTVTVYGHIDSSEVQVGQAVMAGDEIAKMGNRGQSTGPHLHFEVHVGGENKVDPLPWLASRGISLGPERD